MGFRRFSPNLDQKEENFPPGPKGASGLQDCRYQLIAEGRPGESGRKKKTRKDGGTQGDITFEKKKKKKKKGGL